jgi:beta-mannosidase
MFRTRVTDIRIDYNLTDKLDMVNGTVVAEVEGVLDGTIQVEIWQGKKVLIHEDIPIGSNGPTKANFSIESPILWYPHGYGKQQFYRVSVSIVSGEPDPFMVSKRLGIRKTELIQRPDDNGQTFYFRVNHQDIFCGGSNWIPADSFTPKISAERYRSWLQMMVEGNQAMIRYVTNMAIEIMLTMQNLGRRHLRGRHLL